MKHAMNRSSLSNSFKQELNFFVKSDIVKNYNNHSKKDMINSMNKLSIDHRDKGKPVYHIVYFYLILQYLNTYIRSSFVNNSINNNNFMSISSYNNIKNNKMLMLLTKK